MTGYEARCLASGAADINDTDISVPDIQSAWESLFEPSCAGSNTLPICAIGHADLILKMQVNGVTNFFVGRMSSEEFTAAWLEMRAMRRMEGALFIHHGIEAWCGLFPDAHMSTNDQLCSKHDAERQHSTDSAQGVLACPQSTLAGIVTHMLRRIEVS